VGIESVVTCKINPLEKIAVLLSILLVGQSTDENSIVRTVLKLYFHINRLSN